MINLDRATIQRWQQDPVAWMEDQFFIDDEYGDATTIVLADHQKAILREIFRPDENGLLPTEIVYSTIKKSGKTAIGAALGEYIAVAHTPSSGEVIVAANDLEQAQGRVFADIAHSIELNPQMSADMGVKTIKLSTGVAIKAISSDYASSAGSRHSLAIFDELWAYTSEKSKRLYEELTAVPTLPFSARLVVSYAGFELEGDLMKMLVTRGLQGQRVLGDLPVWRNGRLLVYYDTGLEARRMPWQLGVRGAAYYAGEKASLRPNQYLRFHENQFTSNEDRFVDMEKYDARIDPLHMPLLPTKAIPLDVGVDIGPKHDSSGVVATYKRKDGKVALGLVKKWQPLPGSTFIDDVEAFVLDLHAKYRLRSVRYDPYQFMAQAEHLKAKGVPVIEWNPTDENLTAMGANLSDLIKGGGMVLYDEPDLREHVKQAIAIETPRGMRISKKKSSQKIDLCVALAMAALGSAAAAFQPPFRAQTMEVVRAPLRPSLRF